jgi:molecular chaperone HscA
MLLQIYEPGQTPERPKEKGVVVGIDFGTTNSGVAMERDGKVEMIPIEGEKLVPSVVCYKQGVPYVGHSIKDSTSSIRSIKRLMDLSLKNSYEKPPIEISADILKYLKKETEKFLGEPITGAVVTVPAYYNEVAREATRAAAQLAGIPVLRLLSEPTAAALAYHLDEQKEGVYLIYDLGGGTFDVSVLRLQKGVFQVLAVRGDMALGGDDLDDSLFKFFQPKVKKEVLKEEGLLLARQIKESLTTSFIWEKAVKGTIIKITRDILNQLIQPFVERSLNLCHQALRDAEVTKQDVEAVVLVGGTTRIPYLQEQVEKFFEKKPLYYLNPDEVVALGAALHAKALKTGKGKLLLDVTPFSLGIETLGENVEILIPRNSPLPCSVSQSFTTSCDGQTKIKIHVVQGDRPTIKECQSLATFVLMEIPPLPAGQIHLKVTFTLDADGILSVSAEESHTHKKKSVQVTPSYGK